jgi:hypothetical protein
MKGGVDHPILHRVPGFENVLGNSERLKKQGENMQVDFAALKEPKAKHLRHVQCLSESSPLLCTAFTITEHFPSSILFISHMPSPQ